ARGLLQGLKLLHLPFNSLVGNRCDDFGLVSRHAGRAITERVLATGWSVIPDAESCALFCHVSVTFIFIMEGCLVGLRWLLLLLIGASHLIANPHVVEET